MTAANAVGRIAIRGAGNSRLLRAGYAAAQMTARSVGRVLHLLFLQITGLFFCLFALGFASRVPHAYRDQLAGHHGPARTYLLIVLSVVFAWFGITSFWRAHKKQLQHEGGGPTRSPGGHLDSKVGRGRLENR